MLSGLERQANTSNQQARQRAGAQGSLTFASERRLAGFVLVCLSAMFIFSMVWRPADEPAFVLCPFRSLTGLLCPGCGMTRAFCALGHGELRRAIHFNGLSPVLYLSLLVVWVGAAATVFDFPKVRAAVMRLRPNAPVSVAMLALVLVWWVARLVWGL